MCDVNDNMFLVGNVIDFIVNHDVAKVDVEINREVLKRSAKLIGAIDQGTSSTRFMVFSERGEVVGCAQMEHTQIFPSQVVGQSGWHEHDPIEIMRNTKRCIEAVTRELPRKLDAIGITNQRETTVAWNKITGVPYYNAIVWDDTRTTTIATHVSRGNPNRLRSKTGLPIASYFSGTKVKWLLENVPELLVDITEKQDEVAFGTIDSWLIFQLTGTPSLSSSTAINCNGIHATDVTNASRWLFLDIKEQKWDQQLIDTVCAPYLLPFAVLPTIHPSSHVYAVLSAKCGIPSLDNVQLASVLGDQQSALFGQTAFSPGEAKNTYGTGLFLMMNTGSQPVASKHGLLTTIAYQIGNEPVQYALEGSVSHSGSTVQWLRDQLGIISDASETETLATKSNDGLYLVPSFAGLFAPHWDSSARGCLVGLTASHHKGHLCRAALEATCYQTKEVFDAIMADSHVDLKSLKVDGGGTNNKLMMQFQADMIGVPVIRPKVMETTALGAAFAAGLATGVWGSTDEIRDMWDEAERFEPNFTSIEREELLHYWKKAIERSKGWVEEEKRTRSIPTVVMDDVVQEIKTGWNFLQTQEGVSLAVGCLALGSFIGFAFGRVRSNQ